MHRPFGCPSFAFSFLFLLFSSCFNVTYPKFISLVFVAFFSCYLTPSPQNSIFFFRGFSDVHVMLSQSWRNVNLFSVRILELVR